jgi:hypothetical protein
MTFPHHLSDPPRLTQTIQHLPHRHLVLLSVVITRAETLYTSIDLPNKKQTPPTPLLTKTSWVIE